jgi:outer membrane receptor protein involved in Fe transport
MNACYDANSGSSPYCSSFTRDADGQVTNFAEGNYNIGLEVFRALQTSAKWNLPLSRFGLPSSAGQLMFDFNYLHTFRHYYQIGEGDFTKTAGSIGEPTDNFTATATYVKPSFNWMWQATYYGPAKVAVNAADSVYQYPRVGAYVLFNTAVGFNVDDRFSLRLNVNNVFNRGVPFPYYLGATGSETRYFDAIMGRYMRVTAGVKF